jgi:hypothetical protein
VKYPWRHQQKASLTRMAAAMQRSSYLKISWRQLYCARPEMKKQSMAMAVKIDNESVVSINMSMK